jgi:phosphate transport system substrate-binding protein
LDGTSQIGMSSREVERAEFAKARLRGVDLQPIPVAFDAIAIIVNEQNPLTALTHQEVEGLFTGAITNWATLGGRPGRVSAYTRNSSSGTYKAFKDLAMRRQNYGPRTQKLAGNEQIASEVADNPNGVGYVGLAYVETPGVKVLPVDGFMPEENNVRKGHYAYARPLYFLVDSSRESVVKDLFLEFTLGPVGQWIVRQVDFIPVRAPETMLLAPIEIQNVREANWPLEVERKEP